LNKFITLSTGSQDILLLLSSLRHHLLSKGSNSLIRMSNNHMIEWVLMGIRRFGSGPRTGSARGRRWGWGLGKISNKI